MLGLASAGNMISEYHEGLKALFGLLSLFALSLLATRLLYDAAKFKEELKDPAVAGIACTIPMGVSILSTYMEPSLPGIAYAIWVSMIALHFALMAYFTWAFMPKLEVRKLLPAYFVTYVGIAVGAVTAPTFGAHTIGQLLFWFGFASYLVLLPLIAYRAVVVRGVPEPIMPSMAIFAAPASLCLAGYLRSFETRELWLVGIMFALSLSSYFVIIAYLPRLLRLRFYPSISAFTFPLVISAIATNATFEYLLTEGIDQPIFQWLAWLEVVFALAIILYVIVRYIHFFWVKDLLARS
jgi:exfoliative toxin A/B